MPVVPTPFQEFDPEDIFDEIPKPGMTFEEVACCGCFDPGNSACSVEAGFGEVYTTAVAQALAFWMTP